MKVQCEWLNEKISIDNDSLQTFEFRIGRFVPRRVSTVLCMRIIIIRVRSKVTHVKNGKLYLDGRGDAEIGRNVGRRCNTSNVGGQSYPHSTRNSRIVRQGRRQM